MLGFSWPNEDLYLQVIVPEEILAEGDFFSGGTADILGTVSYFYYSAHGKQGLLINIYILPFLHMLGWSLKTVSS